MRLKPVSDLERPRASTVTAAAVTRAANEIRTVQATYREAENRLRVLLYTLWVSNVMVQRVLSPSWVASGHATFEEFVRTLGVSPEFARKALVVHREFYMESGAFAGFNQQRALSIHKMYQVWRVARGVREANNWLQVAATSTTEELDKLIASELSGREGHDTRTLTAAMHLKGEDISTYLNFTRDSVAAYGTETVDRRVMRAIRYYMAHELTRKRLRVA